MDMSGMTMSTATATASAATASTTTSMDMDTSCQISTQAYPQLRSDALELVHSRRMYAALYSIQFHKLTKPPGFLSESWHVRSRGMFAGSCIGVICLVLSLELLRRLGREYDSFIVRRARLRRLYMPSSSTTQSISNVPLRSEEDTKPPGNCCGNTDPDATYSSADDDLITPVLGHHQNGASKIQAAASAAAAPANAMRDVGIQRTERQEALLAPYRPSFVEHFVRSLLHMVQFAVAYIIMLLAMYFNGYIIICIFIGAFLGAFIFSWEPVNLNQESDALSVTKCCG
ncbi:unnamed protein product [Penicillium glandicola]